MKQKIFFVWRHIMKLSLFFLWGFIKDIYQNNTHTIAVLKAAITEKTQVTTQEECGCVINNTAYRIQLCLGLNNRRLEHVPKGSSEHFWFMFETKWYPFTFQLNVISITLSFVDLDLCPLLLFHKFLSILYVLLTNFGG